MSLKPWYKLVTPREDLRDGRPLDASEFAVHLDQVRDGRAQIDYQDPKRFFERTFMTESLIDLSSQVVRRLSGEKTETSAVFNLSTQFGGGKTHALTLLYHLANTGPAALNYSGVPEIMMKATVGSIPKAAIAAFVGTEFDSITGRGGTDGTPLRKTPWGEIAFQLGGEKSFKVVETHEKEMSAPGGDVIRQMLPKNKPCLILMDELMNYISRYRKIGLSDQLYDFLQNLSEVARSEDRVVLVVSIPASVLEMTEADHSDFERIKKMLNRLGKAMVMSAESETSEIIRRRLFEWNGLPTESRRVIAEYATWVQANKQQLSNVLGDDNAKSAFESTYPFHPMVLSVFERKWRTLPRFQQTRGVLRLLALWVSKAYQEGYRGNNSDPLIDLGSAPFEDPLFRAAVFEQLGESQLLEGVVTTDICGKKDSQAVRQDKEATETIKKMKLHQRVAASIFFESNGGMVKMEASVPEIRLDVSRPDLDIGNVETVLDELSTNCYYIVVERNRYHFSVKENLNKRFADRRASISEEIIDDRLKDEIKNVFSVGPQGLPVDRIFFPTKSSQISDRPIISLVILDPKYSQREKSTQKCIESMTRESGSSARIFKNSLIWSVADDQAPLRDEARKLLAWEEIYNERDSLLIDEAQKSQLQSNYNKAKKDMKEAVWRNYSYLYLLGKDGQIKAVSLGLPHSSAASSFTCFIINKLMQDGDVQKAIGANFLVRNWPPALEEWSTKAVRDAFFSSPLFPRLLPPDCIKDTISKGVSAGTIAYVGKGADGQYEPAYFESDLRVDNIEISDDMYIVTAKTFKDHQKPPVLTKLVLIGDKSSVLPGDVVKFEIKGYDQLDRPMALSDVVWEYQGGQLIGTGALKAGDTEGQYTVIVRSKDIVGTCQYSISKVPPPPRSAAMEVSWEGILPDKLWAIFYTKVLSKFAGDSDIKINISINIKSKSEDGLTKQTIEDAKMALRELGLNDNIQSKGIKK